MRLASLGAEVAGDARKATQRGAVHCKDRHEKQGNEQGIDHLLGAIANADQERGVHLLREQRW